MIPLYILGMLLRYGPQHGYLIRKLLEEQMADFTEIKLPTVYYHLEKMEAGGLIEARQVKEGERPEKRVYGITPAGEERFGKLLERTLEIKYRPGFDVDAALFFSDSIENDAFINSLEEHAQRLRGSLERIARHREEVVPYVPVHMQGSAELIFAHHELHCQAELEWALRAAQRMKEDNTDG